VTVAVFSSSWRSATDGSTVPTRVTVAEPPFGASVPRLHVRAVAVNVGGPGVTDAGTRPAGMGSVRATPVAALGPLFVTVSA
jgi:hypothetical protein